ncbi:methyltransferase [Sphaerisporangium fuscum]|uniref:methyltransferase n=1 Tax=Sphaerisporangium fuscum TaxID=2835868 RepID=UPI001BDC3134|nr:methyltransferase [Sphaerisporangium fuscum]
MSGSGELPDISGFARVRPEAWRAFGLRLAEVGFGPAYCAAMWRAPRDRYPGLHRPIHQWRASGLEEPAADVYRLFCLGQPIGERAAAAALTRPVLATALDAGLLLEAPGGTVRSDLLLRAQGDLFVLCDDVTRRGDAVFGGGLGNEAFRGVVSARWPAGVAADIGCGAGAAALALSRHASRVVATDVNERALALARVNARVNGVTTVEFRSGDLFDPVAGERFDLIVAQPPFVPRPPETAEAAYLYGGRRGVDLPSRVIAGAPAHLRAGGRAAVVYEAPVTSGGDDADPWRLPAPEPGLCGLRLLGSPVDADVYSTRYALPLLREGVASFDAAVPAMRTHLARVGLAALRPAIAVFERPAATCRGWRETVQVDGSLWDGVAPLSIVRLLRGISAVHRGRDAVLAAPIRVPGDALVIEAFAGPADVVHLALPPGHLGRTVTLSRADLDLLRGTVAGSPDRRLHVRTLALRAGLWDDDAFDPKD